MIKNQFIFPEYYINKVAYCDECNIPLRDKGIRLLSNPPKLVMICPKCNKEYQINEKELIGEWKWRTI